MPLLLALSSVFATMGLVALPSQIVPMDEAISEVILLIGLAVGIDYSLFYIRRERDERRAGRSEQAALEAAAATSGRAVLISGFTVMIAMAGMFFSGDKTFMSFAIGTMMVVGVAMIGSLTVLPAVLSWLGDRVDKVKVPFLWRLRRDDGEGRVWGGILDRVLRRPLVSALASAAVLVALALPALQPAHLDLGPRRPAEVAEGGADYNRSTTRSRVARPRRRRDRRRRLESRAATGGHRASRRRRSHRARRSSRSTSRSAPTARWSGSTSRSSARARTPLERRARHAA